jgi:hypothetical protein
VDVTLCVLLWAHPGRDDELVAYEDRVLPLVVEHGGRVRERARSDGTDGAPLEVHIIEFPSKAAFEAYLVDDRRAAMAAERDAAIARTQVLRVELS